VATRRAAREQDAAPSEADVREALIDFDPLWELFPTEQARIVQLLVERVDITGESASIRLRTEGLASLVRELRARPGAAQAEQRDERRRAA
jgi:hypothetical protein